MTNHTCQEFLLTEEYNDASDLNKRIQIQEAFSTRIYPWFEWIFNQLDLPAHSRILELGCGPGNLWVEHESHLPGDWSITLSDMSGGMVQEAAKNLENSSHDFTFTEIEAQSIPFKNDTFDAVIANGLFDHVSDRSKAFSEVYRVLKSNGQLYSSAGSFAHLRELRERVKPFIPDVKYGGAPEIFGLENGSTQLSEWFRGTTLYNYRDKLVFNEVEPIVAYVLSEASAQASLVGQKRSDFVGSLREELATSGEFTVTIDKGLFKAYK